MELAVLVALLPSSLQTPSVLAADFLPTVLIVAWLALSGALLLRGHAAAWLLFGVFAVGGREVLGLLAQPAAADRAAGWMSAALLAAGVVAVLAGRRLGSVAATPPHPGPLPPEGGEGVASPGSREGVAPTTPWSGSA